VQETWCHDGQDDDCDGHADCADLDCSARDAEVCNGVDDDCNGLTDEGYGLGAPCTAGQGICARTGTLVCKPGGTSGCSASPGPSDAEKCNTLDDDCNGLTDEGFALGTACTAGLGICARTGTTMCKPDGSAGCSATPGASETEKCNALDDNCDGTTDEGFDVGQLCTVGLGECVRTGTWTCQPGGTVACSAAAGAPGREICDDKDNDCDGATDEPPQCGGPGTDVAENVANWAAAESPDNTPSPCSTANFGSVWVSAGAAPNVVAGTTSVVVDYNYNVYFQCVFPASRDANWDLSRRSGLHFWVRHGTLPSYVTGWQYNAPLVVLCGPSGTYRVLTPSANHLGTTFAETLVPLAGGSGWTAKDTQGFSLSTVRFVEFHQNPECVAYSNGGYVSVYYDDVRFY